MRGSIVSPTLTCHKLMVLDPLTPHRITLLNRLQERRVWCKGEPWVIVAHWTRRAWWKPTLSHLMTNMESPGTVPWSLGTSLPRRVSNVECCVVSNYVLFHAVVCADHCQVLPPIGGVVLQSCRDRMKIFLLYCEVSLWNTVQLLCVGISTLCNFKPTSGSLTWLNQFVVLMMENSSHV